MSRTVPSLLAGTIVGMTFNIYGNQSPDAWSTQGEPVRSADTWADVAAAFSAQPPAEDGYFGTGVTTSDVDVPRSGATYFRHQVDRDTWYLIEKLPDA